VIDTQSGPVQERICCVHEVDQQQLRLLDLLRAEHGETLTFAQLRGSGVVYPASVVSELILVGYPIERVLEEGRPAGVRLRANVTTRSKKTCSSPQIRSGSSVWEIEHDKKHA
jgi:hypothetical protein